MPHPNVENSTPFAFETLFLTDEEGRPIVVPVVKATWKIGKSGILELKEQQPPVDLAGTFWGEPGVSSFRYEPEISPPKPGTDCVLVGYARAPRAATKQLDVRFRCGPVQKTVRVTGDRWWSSFLGWKRASSPIPFETVPLVYERAFGGWDRSLDDPAKHRCDPRNSVGVGYRRRGGKFEADLALPNLEDPRKPLKRYGQSPPPAGFGFTMPHWQPRAKLGGTYDEAWMTTRRPLLPKDFNPSFHNAAPRALITPKPLLGNELVEVANAWARPKLAFKLPGQRPPWVVVRLWSRKDEKLETQLDTVIVDSDVSELRLIWRAKLELQRGVEEVRELQIGADGFARKTEAA